MNLTDLKTPYLSLTLEEKRSLISSVRVSRLTVKQSTKKTKSKKPKVKKVKELEELNEKELEKKIEAIQALLRKKGK